MTQNFQLYGGDISYFTGKVRAYLRFKAIPFVEHPATRDVYKDIILPRVGWPVIPVVVTPEGDTLQDTSDIIDALEARYPDVSVYPSGPCQRIAALLLEVYGDEWLKLPAMHYRWNHNTQWIIREFGRLSRPDLDAQGQQEAGERACRPFRGSLPALGVNDVTAAAIEASYEALLGELDAHFATHRFLFGTRPSIGDFGLIGPLYAHQYRDPASGVLMRRLAPHVVEWVERMMEPEPLTGDFLADDAIPATLLPVLRRFANEHLPVIGSTLTAVADWIDAHPRQAPPRAIGSHAFSLGEAGAGAVTSERAIFPFDQWMFQRPLDCFGALRPAQQDAVRVMLRDAGAAEALDVVLRHRLTRRNFQLVVDDTAPK
jgi:glutathione S-transferase